MEPEEFRGQEGADYMAQVDFECSKDEDSIAQESTSTAVFGTSMSARLILGLK